LSSPRGPLFRASDPREVDAVEQHRDLCRVDLHAGLAAVRLRTAEKSGLEAVVEDDEAIVVPSEDLHAVATAREEDEVAAGVNIFAPCTLDDSGEAIDAFEHVEGIGREQDAHRAGQKQHGLPQPREELGQVARRDVAREVYPDATGQLDDHPARRLLPPR
jgi:hypothetical protein